MINKPNRLTRALQLRDIAVEALKQRGVWALVEIGDGKNTKVLQIQTGDLHVVMRTPFQQIPDVPKSEHMKYLATFKNLTRTHLLPYGLDIWSSDKKVFTIGWDDSGNCELDYYRPGAWEAKLKELASPRFTSSTKFLRTDCDHPRGPIQMKTEESL